MDRRHEAYKGEWGYHYILQLFLMFIMMLWSFCAIAVANVINARHVLIKLRASLDLTSSSSSRRQLYGRMRGWV